MSEELTMICKKCGAQIDDNLTECNFCGAVLKETSEAEETKVIDTAAVNEAVNGTGEGNTDLEQPDETEMILDANEMNRRVQMNRLKVEKQQQLDEIERRRIEKKKKQRRNRVVAVLIIVLALGAIGGGVYYLSQNQSDTEIVVDNKKPTEKPLPTVAPEDETEAPEEEPEEETEAVPTWIPAGNTGRESSSGGRVSGSSGSASGRGTASGSRSGGSASGGTAGAAGGAAGSTGASNAQAAGGSAGGASSSGTASSAGGTESGSRANSSASASQGGSTSTAAATTPVSGDYSNVGADQSGYIFSDSSSRRLTEADLAGKSAAQLRIARNEIYARHGRRFKDASLQNYFNSCPWYSVNNSYNYSNDAANLNNIEQANASFIREYEKSHQ